jgi:two-component system, OmpR family, sensor histidine kinase BaeS
VRRLAHSLSLLLAGFTLVALTALAALAAWNLQRGFSDYLLAREQTRLEGLVQRLETQLAGLPPGTDIRWRQEWQTALRDFGASEGATLPRRPPPLGPDADGPQSDARPLPGGPEGFGARASLFSVQGERLAGRLLADGAEFFELPVRANGATVALARLRKPARVPNSVEANFIARQYAGIVALAVVLMLLAAVAGHVAAARWVKPLLAVRRATMDIAGGARHVVLDESRADEIGDVMRDVNRMGLSLARLEQSRRRWTAEIAHELRTPLSVLRGEIEALVDGVRPTTPLAIKSLHEEVLRLTRLVDDLHTLSVSDLGSLALRPAPVDVVELVRLAQKRVADRVQRAGHRLTVTVTVPEPVPGAETGLMAPWDEQRIAQVLDNLLGNSIRHTQAPGCIAMDLSYRDELAIIRIDDSAPGVPEADLARIFEPLFRADPARSGEGSGLGLAIVRAIVEAHGGRITAGASELGGLRVRVQLPLAARQA